MTDIKHGGAIMKIKKNQRVLHLITLSKMRMKIEQIGVITLMMMISA